MWGKKVTDQLLVCANSEGSKWSGTFFLTHGIINWLCRKNYSDLKDLQAILEVGKLGVAEFSWTSKANFCGQGV